MIPKLLLAMSTVVLAVSAAAPSFHIRVDAPGVLQNTSIKTGEYRLQLKQDTAILSQGRKSVEAPVKVESMPEKYRTTSIKYVDGTITEIRLGGTHTKLVFPN